MDLLPTEFEAEDSWVEKSWTEDKPLEFLSMGRVRNSPLPDAAHIFKRVNALYTLTIKMAREKKIYIRKSYNFNEWLEKTGGLFLIFDLFFVSIVVFFTAREYRSTAIHEQYKVVTS